MNQPTGPGSGTQMTDIHDIKPLEPLGMDPYLWLYVLAGLVCLALLLFCLVYWQRRKLPSVDREEPVLPPERIALNALEELVSMIGANGRLFYFHLSAILRSYIEARHGIHAREMTSEEFLPHIDAIDVDRGTRQELKTLVRSADPIKYAGFGARTEQMHKDMDFVKQYVQMTAPVREDV